MRDRDRAVGSGNDAAPRWLRLAETRSSGYITGHIRRFPWASRKNAPSKIIDLALVSAASRALRCLVVTLIATSSDHWLADWQKKAQMLRAFARLSARPSPASRRRKVASLPRYADPRSSEPISTLAVLAKKDARWRSDAISARYEHHQQHHQTNPVRALARVADQNDDDLFIASLTVAEIRRGVLEKPPGKRRDELEKWFAGPDGPQILFAGRVLSFDEKAGLIWARLMADGRAKGRPRSALDTIIAAVAEANGCIVVTDNEKDSFDIKIVNPIRDSGA